jgi:pimeloyl-ACP methyl ester carboxylesterase
MPAYDGRTKLEALRDHFETFGKGANYLLVGHGAGFAGCLTLVTQHQAEVQPEPLVLLHGNGSMIQDFASSGLLDKAAAKYRVIVFDRPGFGYSERPRLTVWTPGTQADLIRKALGQLGISQAIVLGHSWGASVAIALALKDPKLVTRLILASGYYYPTVRSDVLASWQALPSSDHQSSLRSLPDFRKRWLFGPRSFAPGLPSRLS